MVTTAGAETLPFLASCVVLPASLGFFMLYGKIVEALPSVSQEAQRAGVLFLPCVCQGTKVGLLHVDIGVRRVCQPSNVTTSAPCLAQRAVFYAALSPLVAFYLAFAALLYPLHGSLHLNGFYAATAALVPQGLHGLLKGEDGGQELAFSFRDPAAGKLPVVESGSAPRCRWPWPCTGPDYPLTLPPSEFSLFVYTSNPAFAPVIEYWAVLPFPSCPLTLSYICSPPTLLPVIEYWTFSLFYCASELWGSVVISVLFWSLANEVCTISEAKVGAWLEGHKRVVRVYDTKAVGLPACQGEVCTLSQAKVGSRLCAGTHCGRQSWVARLLATQRASAVVWLQPVVIRCVIRLLCFLNRSAPLLLQPSSFPYPILQSTALPPQMQTVYPLMGIAANFALVLSGSWVKWVNATLVPAAGGSTQVRLKRAGGLLQPAVGMGGQALCLSIRQPLLFGLAELHVSSKCALADAVMLPLLLLLLLPAHASACQPARSLAASQPGHAPPPALTLPVARVHFAHRLAHSPARPKCVSKRVPHSPQAMLNYLVGTIVLATGVMMAAKFALDRCGARA